MIRELVPKYYLEQNNNCAEALLHAAAEALSLNLPPEAFRLVAGYGSGMGCGLTCGAISCAVAVVSQLAVGARAHETPGFKRACAGCVAALRGALGGAACRAHDARDALPAHGRAGGGRAGGIFEGKRAAVGPRASSLARGGGPARRIPKKFY